MSNIQLLMNFDLHLLFLLLDESALQIVPFSLFNPYTETLKLESRLFQFGPKLIKVQQHWQPGGRGGTDIGFGASVYDCSIVLSYFLYDIADQISGRTVIELGCGKVCALHIHIRVQYLCACSYTDSVH